VAVTFNGTGSSDPDGDPLGYMWSFGDGATGAGATPAHAYVAGGTFVVSLTVGDGFNAAAATTIASIQDVFPARAFTTGGNATIRLGSAKATWCTQIEPVLASYLNTAVIPSTISMSFGAGRISAEAGKLTIGGDKDGNGVDELTACFSKADLRTLFTALPHGTSTVTVTLEGGLTTGGMFRGTLTVNVVSTGGSLVASLSPNPLNPDAQLSFTTSRAGRVKVSVFDLQGRLVRRVMEEGTLSAGYHDVRVDGRSEEGARLPSGVYFYRVEAPEGTAVGRVVIAK
jgi:PKD repeat protein